MLAKPTSCQGCPFYGDGQGFVPDELVPGARVMILGQNPGASEERLGKPFVGSTGELQSERFLPLANLDRGKDVHIANVLKCRWTGPDGHKTNSLPEGEELQAAVAHCTAAHLTIPAGTELLVAQGALSASWCAGRPIAVHQWRGHVLWPVREGLPKTYVVEHLAAVARDPRMWWVSEVDWRKIPRALSGTWPLEPPPRLIASRDNWSEVLDWFAHARRRAPYVAIDTEFEWGGFGSEGCRLLLIGLGYPKSDGVITGVQLDVRGATQWMTASFYRQLEELVTVCPVLFQNFAADMPVLKYAAGIPYHQYKGIHDTMLAHAVMYCELPHTLEFLTSLYGTFRKLKHLMGEDLLLYNWGDVIETISAWEHLRRGLETDSAANHIYESQSLRLIPILLKSMERGIKVNKPRVMAAKAQYEEQARAAQRIAELYYGRPINLGSDDQVMYYCYRERGYPVQVHRETKNPTINEDAVAWLRDYVGPAPDPDVPLTPEVVMERIAQGADPILEARVLYGEAQHLLDSYIYGLVRSVYWEHDENKRKRARELVKAHGFTEADLVDRIYPHFAIHAQKNARWSTTDPPLAQLPPSLRDIIIPDDGECWIHWDWKGIELHLLEAHSRSRVLRRAHEENMDLHTWTACKLFHMEFPPNLVNPHTSPECEPWRTKYQWKGKDDPRRIFAKQSRYEMCVPLDTLILTRDGWKAHNEVEIGEAVLVYNQETHQKEWGTLLDKVYYDAVPCDQFGNQLWRVTATPQHRWFVRKKRPYLQQEVVMTTAELDPGCNLVVNAPMAHDPGLGAQLEQPKHGTAWTREVCRMSTEERAAFIRGFALADGSYRNGCWLIDQKDGPLWEAILTACFIHYGTVVTTRSYPSRGGTKRLQICKKPHVPMGHATHTTTAPQPVWCPVTSHGSWVMRQGDCITITGNCYGGQGATAAERAIRMGLRPEEVRRAANELLTADLDYYRWRQAIEREVKQTRVIRTFMGRPRRFLLVSKYKGLAVPPKVVREALDYPMQAGVSDVFNTTIILIAEKYPFMTLAWSMHDSQYWAIPKSQLTPELYADIQAIVTREFNVNGYPKRFPADLHVIDPQGGKGHA